MFWYLPSIKRIDWSWKGHLRTSSVVKAWRRVVIIYNYLTYVDYFAYFDYVNVFGKGSIIWKEGIKGSARDRVMEVRAKVDTED